MLLSSLQAPRGCVFVQSHTSTWGSVLCSWNQGEGEASLLSASFLFSPEEPKHPFRPKELYSGLYPQTASGGYCWVLAVLCYFPSPSYLFNMLCISEHFFLLLLAACCFIFHPYSCEL